MKVNYDGLPERLRGGVQRYLEHRLSPGGFLTAVFENDLMGALGRAGLENQRDIVRIATWVYNEMPGNCWGSVKIVEKWLAGEEGGKSDV